MASEVEPLAARPTAISASRLQSSRSVRLTTLQGGQVGPQVTSGARQSGNLPLDRMEEREILSVPNNLGHPGPSVASARSRASTTNARSSGRAGRLQPSHERSSSRAASGIARSFRTTSAGWSASTRSGEPTPRPGRRPRLSPARTMSRVTSAARGRRSVPSDAEASPPGGPDLAPSFSVFRSGLERLEPLLDRRLVLVRKAIPSPVGPCLSALRRAAALPASVPSPYDRRAFPTVAASCAGLQGMTGSLSGAMSRTRGDFFWGGGGGWRSAYNIQLPRGRLITRIVERPDGLCGVWADFLPAIPHRSDFGAAAHNACGRICHSSDSAP